MLRGPLGEKNYKPKFSGHDTFPFRYQWLTKLAFYLNNNGPKIVKEFEKNRESNIVNFGVGLNMVKSLRHWGIYTKVCDQDYNLTHFGKKIFSSEKSYDPYLEKTPTLWLLHFELASNPELTTWFYAFNYYESLSFDREKLTNDIYAISQFSKWRGNSPNTIKRDVDCFIRTYTVSIKKGELTEDSLECPLAELNLISNAGSRNTFEFQRGPKNSLSLDVFEYALNRYWEQKQSRSEILTFEKIMYDFGSPGKVFLLDEKSVDEYLEQLDSNKNSSFRFVKGAGGLKQIQKIRETKDKELIQNCYRKSA